MRIALWLTHTACIAVGALIVTSFHAPEEDVDLPLVLNSPRTPVPAPPITEQPAQPERSAALLSATMAVPVHACSVLPTDVLSQLMPHYRRDLKAAVRGIMAKNYPGVAEELGLNQAEANALYDLAQKYQSIMNGVPADHAGMDDISRQELDRARTEIPRMQDAEIAALLGASRYQKWQQYQPTLAAHRLLDVWLRNIRTGMPALTEGQTRSLVNIIAAEQRSVTGDEVRDIAIREESNTRILESARPYLGAEQYTAMKEIMTRMVTSERNRLLARDRSPGASQ